MTAPITRNLLEFDFTKRFDNGVEGTKNIFLAARNAFYYGVPASLATLGCLLSFGYSKTLNECAKQVGDDFSINASSVSVAIFETALSVINPDAKLAGKLIHSETVVYQEDEEDDNECKGTVLSSRAMPFIEDVLESAEEKGPLYFKSVFAASFLALEIALIIDYGIGLIAATFACLSGGTFPELNLLARASLESDVNIVKCFHQSVLKIICPEETAEL